MGQGQLACRGPQPASHVTSLLRPVNYRNGGEQSGLFKLMLSGPSPAASLSLSALFLEDVATCWK